MQQKNKKGIKWQNFEALAIVSDFSNPSFAQLNQYAPIFRKLIPIVTNNIYYSLISSYVQIKTRITP